MRERRGLPGIFEETGKALGIGDEIVPHDPERDRPSMLGVAGPIQLADTSGTNAFEDLVVGNRLEHRSARIIVARESLSRSPQAEPQLPSPLRRPDDLAARRLVQHRRRVRAGPRPDRLGDDGRVDADRPVPAGGDRQPGGWRGRRPRRPAPADDCGRHPARGADSRAAARPAAGPGVDRLRRDGADGRAPRRSSNRPGRPPFRTSRRRAS